MNLAGPQIKLLRVVISIDPERSTITHGLRTGVEATLDFINSHVEPVDMKSLNGWVFGVGPWWIDRISFWVPIVNPEAVRSVVITPRDCHSAVYVMTLEPSEIGHTPYGNEVK